jgi:hypothetical protein
MISGNLVEEILIKWSCLTYNWTLVIIFTRDPDFAFVLNSISSRNVLLEQGTPPSPPRGSKVTIARPFFLSELDTKIALAGLRISGRYFPPS